MNAHEIIVEEMQSDCRLQVSEGFRERVGKTGKSTHLHTHSQILPFDKAGRNVLGIRFSGNNRFRHSGAVTGGIADFGVIPLGGGIVFGDLGIVNV